MDFQWYPGHMTKAKRMMQENMKLIDIMIELVDARIPLSSRNPDIDQLAANKSRLILLNKTDMADERVTAQWEEYFKEKGFYVARTNARSGKGVKGTQAIVMDACKGKLERDRKRGIKNRPIRAMVVGIPNVGKSTFINLITREVFPLYRDHPPVLFKGKSLVTLQEIKQCLGVVSATMQNQITVHLPVFEVVYGGLLGSLGVPRQYTMNEEGKAKVAKTLEFLGIAHLADRDVMTLSSGQARRVLIARALVHDPDVLVLDEPTTGLDPEGMYYVRKTMRDLTEVGKAIILVTHYPEDIIPEIKRVVMIKDGKLFADKPKEEALTTACVSELFDVPLRILSQDGYYSLVTEY